MTEAEFVEVLSRLENYFEKEYTTFQRQEMYGFLKKWNKEKFNRVVNWCIQNCKFLPKLADFNKASFDSNGGVRENIHIDFVPCDKCYQGFVRYYRTIQDGDRTLKYEYVALCTCQNGEMQREINGYKIPTIAEIGLDK